MFLIVGGDGTYAVPGVGSLVYCGLQGWMSLLKPIMARNDLGHSLCEHLRAGPWTMDYITSRLQKWVLFVMCRVQKLIKLFVFSDKSINFLDFGLPKIGFQNDLILLKRLYLLSYVPNISLW